MLALVSCVAWVPRGKCKEVPHKVVVSKDEINTLVEKAKKYVDPTTKNLSENVSREEDDDDSDDEIAKYYGLDEDDDDDENGFFTEDVQSQRFYQDNSLDPYLNSANVEESSDEEQFKIGPDDNVVVFSKVDGSIYNDLEFFVYNSKERDFFAHHSIILKEIPTCLEWISHQLSASEQGNYVAVGTSDSAIELWDVDVENSAKPSCRFEIPKKKKKKTKKKTKRLKTDDDEFANAVLDLSWNKSKGNILASASANKTLALWDVDTAKTVDMIENFDDKVQSVRWHPSDGISLLAGSCDRSVRLIDSRDSSEKVWKCEGEVENVLWNHFDPSYCFASSDEGTMCCFDIRSADEAPVWQTRAYNSKPLSGFCLSCSCPGFLVTASSEDTDIKIWDYLDGEPKLVSEFAPDVGNVSVLSMSPDSPFDVFCGGNSKCNNYCVRNLSRIATVKKRFKNRVVE